MTAALWVPGELVATNRALDDQRAAGFYAGLREGMIRAGKWRADAQQSGQDRYAAAAHQVRRRVAFQARAGHVQPVDPAARVALRFTAQGYPRWDASGAMLVAKWGEDGLVDAGVLASDRHNVASVTVTVVQHPLVADPPPGLLIGWEVVP